MLSSRRFVCEYGEDILTIDLRKECQFQAVFEPYCLFTRTNQRMSGVHAEATGIQTYSGKYWIILDVEAYKTTQIYMTDKATCGTSESKDVCWFYFETIRGKFQIGQFM